MANSWNWGGSGILMPEILDNAGFDAQEVQSFAFDLGLERLAMLKYDIDDIRELWQPPYVPK